MSQDPQEIAEAQRGSKAPLARVAGELLGMARWKKKLLAFFLLIAAVGAVMRVPAWLDPQPVPDVTSETAADESAPPGARGFVDSSRQPTGASTAAESQAEASTERPLPWTARLGGWMARLGLSFAGGLVVGVFFRSFLKTMAAITALIVVGLGVLSYFQVIGIDLGTMRQNYDSFSGWMGEQGYRLKDLAVGVLPSFGAGVAGFFVGFLRR